MTIENIIIVALFFVAFFLITTVFTQQSTVKRIKRTQDEVVALRKRVLFLEDPEAAETTFNWDFKI